MVKFKQEINNSILTLGLILFVSVTFIGCSSTKTTSRDGTKISWDDPNPFEKAQSYSFDSPESKGTQRLLFLFSGHTMGEIDVCGCTLNPKGGIDRRLNFARSLRLAREIPVIFLDAGNALFATEEISKSQLKNAEARADLILRGYKAMLNKALNVGTLDLSLGVEKLKSLAKKNEILLLSSNLSDKGGQLLFEKEYSFKVGNQEILVLGVSAGSEQTQKKGVVAQDPKITIENRLKSVNENTMVIVLSDLGQPADEQLAKSIDRKLMIVGSRETFALEIPLHIHNSIVMRPHFQGQQWTQVELDWKPKAEGWYNFFMGMNFKTLWDMRKKAFHENKAQENSEGKKIEVEYIENSRKEMISYLPGDVNKKVFYLYQNLNLSETYSKPNEFTPLIKKLVK